MLGMKNHFDISDSIEIREVDIAGVACMYSAYEIHCTILLFSFPFGRTSATWKLTDFALL